MTLNDLLKLKRKYPKNTLIELQLDGHTVKDFDMEFKYTSEGQWVITIKPRTEKHQTSIMGFQKIYLDQIEKIAYNKIDKERTSLYRRSQ